MAGPIPPHPWGEGDRRRRWRGNNPVSALSARPLHHAAHGPPPPVGEKRGGFAWAEEGTSRASLSVLHASGGFSVSEQRNPKPQPQPRRAPARPETPGRRRLQTAWQTTRERLSRAHVPTPHLARPSRKALAWTGG